MYNIGFLLSFVAPVQLLAFLLKIPTTGKSGYRIDQHVSAWYAQAEKRPNSNLSFPKAIEVDDLNNAIPTEDGRIGFYRFSNIASNSPQTGYFGFAITYRISNLYYIQIAFTNDQKNILYKRTTSGGTWYEWVSNQ